MILEGAPRAMPQGPYLASSSWTSLSDIWMKIDHMLEKFIAQIKMKEENNTLNEIIDSKMFYSSSKQTKNENQQN